MTPNPRRITDLVKGLVTFVAVTGFMIAIPVGLIRYIGWPVPTELPTLDQVAMGLRSSLDPQLVIKTLAVLVWLAWAQLAIALIVETVAAIRGHASQHVPLLPGLQQLAARTVATIAVVAATLGPARAPAAFAETNPPIVYEHTTPATTTGQANISGAVPAEAAVVAHHVGYTVQRFDTLWDIAERTLGDPTRWRDIRQLNTGRTMADGTQFTEHTDHLTAGWELHLPPDATLPPTDDDAGPGETGRTVLVEKGDHFWSIAGDTLSEAWGREPATDEVAPYWQSLVAENRDQLAPPHHPDLIYPGQTFTLPPTPPDPANGHPPSVSAPGEVVVERGDHFWGIAEDTLAEAWDREPAADEVAPYWRSLVEANGHRLRASRDANLIHPGQVFELPAIPDDPTSEHPKRPTDTSQDNPAAPPDEPQGGPRSDSPDPADEATTGTEDESHVVDSTAPAPRATTRVDTHQDNEIPLDEAFTENLVNDEETSDEVEESGGLLPAATRVAGLGILAAGVVALINRLRGIQLRKRRPGTTPTPPPPETAPVETALRTAAAPNALELVDLALRTVGHHIDTNHLTVPELAAVRIAPDGVRLLLWTPHTEPPPGWGIGDDAKSWLLPASTDLEPLRWLTAEIAAPWPAIVTIGHDDNSQLLLNLEHPGALQILGAFDEVQDTLVTMAVELAASPLADGMQIYCVGFGHDLAHLERIHPVDDLDEGLRWIKPILDTIATLPDTTAQPGRQRPGADLWEPVVVLDPSTEPSEQTRELLVAAHPGSPVSAVVGYPTGQRWRLHLDETTIRLEPANVTYRRRNLTAEEQDGVAQLTAAAKDLDGIPDPTTTVALYTVPDDLLIESDPSTEAEAATDTTLPITDPARDDASGAAPEDDPALSTDVEPQIGEVTQVIGRDAVEEASQPGVMVRVLGNVRIDGLLKPFPRPWCREIVAYLATHRHGVSADALHEALWPNQPFNARRGPRYISDARGSLGEAIDGRGYIPQLGDDGLYRPHPELTSDFDQLDSHIQQANTATNPDQMARHLRAALDLVEGPPFTVAERFSWAHTEGFVSHATIAIDDAAHHLADHALNAGSPDEASWAAEKGILVTRNCEQCYRNLMQAGIAAKNSTAVEAAYKRLLATVTNDDGPGAAEYLDPETTQVFEDYKRSHSSQI